MTKYRRDGKSSRAHSKKNRRNRSGQTLGYHQDQDEINSHNGNPGNPYTSGHRFGVPHSPASFAPTAVPGMRLGATHNPNGNPNARQPGNFRTGKGQLDGGAARPTRPPTALSRDPPFVSQDYRPPVASLSNNAAQIASVTSPRAPTPSVANSHGAVPAKGTRVSTHAGSHQSG